MVVTSDQSHFNVSLTVMDKVTRQCPQTTNSFQPKREPKRNRTEALLLTSLNALPLGQIGSVMSDPRRILSIQLQSDGLVDKAQLLRLLGGLLPFCACANVSIVTIA